MKKILKSIGLMSLIFTTALIGFGSSIAQAATYTIADVATHNTSSNCWVIINNNVYNLTGFISTHSGGVSVIKAQCGKNGTASFNSGPHSGSTLSAISSLMLGPLTTVSPILTSITVVPSAPTVIIGGTMHLNATPKNQNGGKFIGATTTFSSSNTTTATVNSTSGIVTGVAVGTATITATSISGSKEVTGTAIVKVTDTSISHENNGKHLGQFKNWFKKWFNNHEDKREKINGVGEKNDSGNDDNEENDD